MVPKKRASPWCRNATRSASLRAKRMSCVTTMLVRCNWVFGRAIGLPRKVAHQGVDHGGGLVVEDSPGLGSQPPGAQSATVLNTIGTERSRSMRCSIPPQAEPTARPPSAIPVATSTPRQQQIHISPTTCRLTRQHCFASSRGRIPACSFISHPPTLPGSTKSRSGLPALKERSSLAASLSLPRPSPQTATIHQRQIQPMPGLFGGPTPTHPDKSAVTNSLRQATSTTVL